MGFRPENWLISVFFSLNPHFYLKPHSRVFLVVPSSQVVLCDGHLVGHHSHMNPQQVLMVTIIQALVGGLEHFYFSIYWE